ncbi:hypothetical protein A8F69_03655 [Burkholderia cenocepacia]|nr:hypothetical protein A8F69_03655 [Burkholderia cenocepacia]OOB34469.1 hypothetical protein A8F74_24470 [Burkholderia cenocepacia]OOB52251.1 hypothetical protein A8F75_26500 [Burkholderia cenocepacia]OOB58332.1 hypothetical protein A8F71_08165 [Burkholderia cenocepacia]PRF30691.1 hypothetical protein C6Q10_32705 [Burkholderia multivorans]
MERLPIVWAVDVDSDANPAAVFVDRLVAVVPISDRPVESEPKPDAVLLDRLVMLAVLLARPVASDVTDCAVPVDNEPNALAMPVDRLLIF